MDNKKKLTLEDLELESIVTSLDEDEAADLLGGCPRCGSTIRTHTCYPGCKPGFEDFVSG